MIRKNNKLIYYNIPYDDEYSSPAPSWDTPRQVRLDRKTDLCGYIDNTGKYYPCQHCQHESIIREIVINEYLTKYLSVNSDFYLLKPPGMFQEEYFAMKYLGFIKISSFKEWTDQMYLFTYNTLSWQQTEIVYPKYFYPYSIVYSGILF